MERSLSIEVKINSKIFNIFGKLFSFKFLFSIHFTSNFKSLRLVTFPIDSGSFFGGQHYPDKEFVMQEMNI